MDEGIRIVWYDLPEDGKEDYLVYIPEKYSAQVYS